MMWITLAVMGSYVHRIDPVIGSVFGVHLWWYGLSYSLGFLNAHLFMRRKRKTLGLSMRSVYDLSLWLALGVLVGGRCVEVVFYEWPFYRRHFWLVPAVWLGGMTTHGLLAGGVTGVWLFCRSHRKSFLAITDALAIPAAFILGMGRLGNFIDGQIVGGVTTVWWGVKFPDAVGFRHPVVLYDGLKNLLLIPILTALMRVAPPPGVVTGSFLFLYASLRIIIDLWREYPTTLAGLATGQSLNILVSAIGLVLLTARCRARGSASGGSAQPCDVDSDNRLPTGGLLWRELIFACLLLFSLVIPSDWTQDVPVRYGSRHAGLRHSLLYPELDTAPGKPQGTDKATVAPNKTDGGDDRWVAPEE